MANVIAYVTSTGEALEPLQLYVKSYKQQVGFSGFPQALEIMENLENHYKKFHAWKNHGI